MANFLDSFSLELQHAIVSTIYFLTEFYAYRPTIHLRHMYLRWNIGKKERERGGGSGRGEGEAVGEGEREGGFE